MEIKTVKLVGTKVPSELFKELITYMACKKEYKDIIIDYKCMKFDGNTDDIINIMRKNGKTNIKFHMYIPSNSAFECRLSKCKMILDSTRDYISLLDGRKKFVVLHNFKLRKQDNYIIKELKKLQKSIGNNKLLIAYRPSRNIEINFDRWDCNPLAECVVFYFKLDNGNVRILHTMYIDADFLSYDDISECIQNKKSIVEAFIRQIS